MEHSTSQRAFTRKLRHLEPGFFRHLRTVLVVAVLIASHCRDVFAQTNLAGEVAGSAPPVVTLVGRLNDPSIPPGQMLVSRTNSVFRYSGARVGQWDTSYPRNLFNVASGVTGAYGQIPFRTAFETDAQKFEILTLGTEGYYRLKVDGQYVALNVAAGPVADGLFYWLRVSFPSAQRRAITLEAIGTAFGGIIIGTEDHVYRTTKSLGARCIVLGDSFAEGLASYAERLADLMGWEVWGSAVGGTGYINPGAAGRVKFRDRVQSDVISNQPDLVIVAGGINDAYYPPDVLRAEAIALYDTILTNLPSARLVVVGPWWPRGNPPQFVLDARNAFRAAATSRGVEFIDPIVSSTVPDTNVGWITGTGNSARPRRDGNADLFIGEDGTHPTDLGHQYLATRLAERLSRVSIPAPPPGLGIQLFAGLQIEGKVGRNYLIQWTDDVVGSNWVGAATLNLVTSPQLWVDTASPNSPRRFYRALLIP